MRIWNLNLFRKNVSILDLFRFLTLIKFLSTLLLYACILSFVSHFSLLFLFSFICKSFCFTDIVFNLCWECQYVDQSVSLKACSSLNGMKFGGQVITAVQAVPNASSLVHNSHCSVILTKL